MADNEPEIAIAIKYNKEEDNAPRVVAKGVRGRAEKILEIARANGVPVMRNIPLAHALNKLEIGDEIPEDLYDAVAEVLQFVFEMSKAEGR
ncbi:MAG TPA: EscU/YscU/HrcU family type III secretion system export apparatus switch protein [Myxococcales bacterium]